jgi:hypothetical protein
VGPSGYKPPDSAARLYPLALAWWADSPDRKDAPVRIGPLAMLRTASPEGEGIDASVLLALLPAVFAAIALFGGSQPAYL